MAEVALMTAFDGVASDYDKVFSASRIGRLLREMVWSHLEHVVRPGSSVLDLGCGTGEDAIWLAARGCRVLACDSSARMLRIVRRKAARSNLADRIATSKLDLNDPRARARLEGQFDLVLSNFGALNCVTDLGALGSDLRRWVKPGGFAALTVMGRFCAWEFAWYAARLERKALRRLLGRSTATIGGRELEVRYWSARGLRRTLQPDLPLQAVAGIGIALPPSNLFAMFDRRPRITEQLGRLDRILSGSPMLAALADHMLVTFRRQP